MTTICFIQIECPDSLKVMDQKFFKTASSFITIKNTLLSNVEFALKSHGTSNALVMIAQYSLLTTWKALKDK